MISESITPSTRHRRSHLFIECEELKAGKWAETSRWNHALEAVAIETPTSGQQKWGRPHLPQVSFPALVRLRAALGASNVLLDIDGGSLCVHHVLQTLFSLSAVRMAHHSCCDLRAAGQGSSTTS